VKPGSFCGLDGTIPAAGLLCVRVTALGGVARGVKFSVFSFQWNAAAEQADN
jgi:hypothetical protein